MDKLGKCALVSNVWAGWRWCVQVSVLQVSFLSLCDLISCLVHRSEGLGSAD
uniref:Uncharacterized protein n=1 Tax=Arundo donax TaxID=35708 RepID=A0A0A9HTZ0_ARUDO